MIKQIDLIACIDKNYGIGNEGRLLFNLKEDMQRFKDITTSKGNKDEEEVIDVVIMGRNTWDSLPEKSKPLKNRVNVILSKKMGLICFYSPNDESPIVVYTSLEDALKEYQEGSKEYNVHIIGGGQVYAQAIEQEIPDILYITHVDAAEYSDTSFPQFLDKYVEIGDEGKRDNGTYSYTFKTYARKQ